MIKRIVSFLLLLSIFCCLWACNFGDMGDGKSKETTSSIQETHLPPIEQTDSNYVVQTDWMTFYFAKKDFKESDIRDIVTEAVSVMADVRGYLGVNYTLKEAEESVCYFDSSYRYDGKEISVCFMDDRVIYCVSLSTFVHEYVHMVSGNHADLVYHPDQIFIEGLAEYIELNFYDSIASQDYVFFKEDALVPFLALDSYDHQRVCLLVRSNGLAYNKKNYSKAYIALLARSHDISKIDTSEYIYQIGYVFVDYCINQLGGLEKFLGVYSDCVTVVDVYGKNVDALVLEACDYNKAVFYRLS